MALIDGTPPDPPDARPRSRLPAVTGDYCCLACGHRILGADALPTCPACGQRAWRLVAWRPFTHPDPVRVQPADDGSGP